jgi:hypothetical protein
MIDYEALKPFPSFLLLQMRQHARNHNLVGDLLHTALHHIQDANNNLHVLTVGEVVDFEDLTYGGVIFEQFRRPAWTIQPQPENHIHELLLIIQRRRLFAVYCSDRQWRDGLFRLARDHDKGYFKRVEPIDPGIMNAAFATGAARTLWLAGIHARSNIKSDSKVVAGMDLVSTLDALDDQSYHFTAARYKSNQLSFRTTIGFSPYESSFWVTQPMHWPEFAACADETLQHLESVHEPNYSPIAVLAAPLVRAEAVSHPFDMSLTAPELRGDVAQLAEDIRERDELWAFNSDFVVTPLGGPNARVGIFLKGNWLGELDLTFDISNPNDVVCHAQIIDMRAPGLPLLQHVQTLFENRSWLTVHYASGHTLLGRTLVSTRVRDVSLEEQQLVWERFDRFDITEEKPARWDELGMEGSLFSWLWANWPCGKFRNAKGLRGWLACDDGANEVADFIHLDEEEMAITLIHVKASGSSEPTRHFGREIRRCCDSGGEEPEIPRSS